MDIMKLNNKVKIHYSFYIFFLLCIFTGNTINFLIFTLSILFHEIFHVLMGLILKVKTNSIELYCLGGFCDINLNNINPVKKLVISLSGILFNVIVIILIKLDIINTFYKDIILNYNLLLIIFNLIPIYPLDGFNILESILELIYKEKYKKSINYSSYISVIFLVLMFVLSIYFQSGCLVIAFIFLGIKNIIYIKNYNLVYLKKIAGKL